MKRKNLKLKDYCLEASCGAIVGGYFGVKAASWTYELLSDFGSNFVSWGCAVLTFLPVMLLLGCPVAAIVVILKIVIEKIENAIKK